MDGYYSIIPATIMKDKTLSANEKLLYAIITTYANNKGYCFASNKAMAEKLGVSDRSVQRWIQKMAEKSYIIVKVIRNDNNEVVERRIYINDTPISHEEPLTTEVSPPHDNADVTSRQECRVENISENIPKKENTTYSPKKGRKKAKFVPPTLEEVQEYCRKRNNNVDPKWFYDFYNDGDWYDSKGNPVLNWKQKVIQWEKDRYKPKDKPPNLENPYKNGDITTNEPQRSLKEDIGW